MIDEIKVHVVVALCEELLDLDAGDARHAIGVDKLRNRWRTLSGAEQEAVAQVMAKRGLAATTIFRRFGI